jgi:hypothetical protein
MSLKKDQKIVSKFLLKYAANISANSFSYFPNVHYTALLNEIMSFEDRLEDEQMFPACIVRKRHNCIITSAVPT